MAGRRKMMRIDGDGMKKGEWTAEEDQMLTACIKEHGTYAWDSIPIKAGLDRVGKSCRLRWLNYLRPGIKKGKFTPQEDEDIIKLQALYGNRWASIAKRMHNRTDNDIKNHWNTYLKKRISGKRLDPMTHEPIINKLLTIKTANETWRRRYPTSRWPSIAIPSSSTSSCSVVRLLNKIATLISSGQLDIDKIKKIFSDMKITRSHQEEEELKKDDHDGDKEDDFPKWNEDKLRHFMEISDVMEYETPSSYGNFEFWEYPLSPPCGIYEHNFLDHLL